MTAIVTLWTCTGNPGLQSITRPGQEPPFGFPWTEDNRKPHPLHQLPKEQTVALIARCIAEHNGDYENRLGMSLSEYIWHQLTE